MLSDSDLRGILRSVSGLAKIAQEIETQYGQVVESLNQSLFGMQAQYSQVIEPINSLFGVGTQYNQAIESLSQSLAGMQAQYSQAAEALNRSLANIFVGIDVKALNDVVERIRTSSPWIQELAEWERVRVAFNAAEFIPSPSMETELVRRVVTAHKNGASPSDLAAMILSYYDENECERLLPVLEKLCENPEFVDWRNTLQQVFAAHQNGLDLITSYPLVAMIEGVLLPFFGAILSPGDIKKMTGKSQVKHNTIAKVIRYLPVSVAFSVEVVAYDCFINYFEERLYQPSDWNTDSTVRTDFANLNRHRLLHGMVTQGTRLNTLRCLFILELIGVFLPTVRAELTCEDGEEENS